MWIRRPFTSRRRSVPRTPLLLLKVLMLPTIPATRTVLPALALVHGERINVVHHASITVRASHTHSPVTTLSVRVHDEETSHKRIGSRLTRGGERCGPCGASGAECPRRGGRGRCRTEAVPIAPIAGQPRPRSAPAA